MDYRQLVQSAGIEYTGAVPTGWATAVTQDGRRVQPGCVFVCIAGQKHDGHDDAPAALAAGAGLVVSQRPLGLEREITVADTRAANALLCAAFFGHPARKLQLVGVTGTNGKTTVTSVLKQVLAAQGLRCGLIGTNQCEIADMVVPAKFTTPEPWDLHALFARMVQAGCTHAVLEASSQALVQKRLFGLRFALGVFTNLTPDHLDVHGDMEGYFAAKRLLLAQSEAALTNLDDPWGRRLLEEKPATGETYSFSAEGGDAEFSASNVELRAGEVRFGFFGRGFLWPVAFPTPGGYSVANALAAGAAAVLLGCDATATARALSAVTPVRGRCEVLVRQPFTVICDFAHTADAIDKLLGALRPFVRGRLVALYGCAGDRDPLKRPAMSEAVLRWADEAVLTADNPRTEPAEKTMADALPPLEAGGKPYTLEPDRAAAVRLALGKLAPGDMLVLCGKGHEDYQVMDGITLYLDEHQLTADWISTNV